LSIARKLRTFGFKNIALSTGIYLIIGIFLVYPVVLVFYQSVVVDGNLTVEYYGSFLSNLYYAKCFGNSLAASIISVALSALIGIPMAYFISRYKLPGGTLFTTISLITMIMPPFLSAIAFIFLFGRYGTINLILMDWLRVTHEPVNFIYGLSGLISLETLHLYPLIYLNTSAAMTRIDSELEESAEIQGASGLTRFLTVTLPLATPGVAAGAFLAFIWVFSDWMTPLTLGLQDYLAPQAYSDLTQFTDVSRFENGVVGCVIIALFSVVALLLMRKYVSLREYVSLSKGATRQGRIIDSGRSRRYLALFFCCLVAVLSLLGPIWLTISSFAKIWELTPFPLNYSLDNFIFVFAETPIFIFNSFRFSGVALLIDLMLGLTIAFLLGRSQIPGNALMDSLVTTIIAVPGIVLGIGYLRGFHSFSIPVIGETLTHLWIIMALAIAMKRVPYVVRSSYASLLQTDRAFEEASEILGASRLRTFFAVDLPLIYKGVFSGSLLSFVTGINEVSSTMFLFLPGWETMTIGTLLLFSSGGRFGSAAALGVILMIVTSVTIVLASKIGEKWFGATYDV
jgi:iron(III) transport system permease protein